MTVGEMQWHVQRAGDQRKAEYAALKKVAKK